MQSITYYRIVGTVRKKESGILALERNEFVWLFDDASHATQSSLCDDLLSMICMVTNKATMDDRPSSSFQTAVEHAIHRQFLKPPAVDDVPNLTIDTVGIMVPVTKLFKQKVEECSFKTVSMDGRYNNLVMAAIGHNKEADVHHLRRNQICPQDVLLVPTTVRKKGERVQ